MRNKILNFFLDILELLRSSVSVMHDSYSLDCYLIMLDECAHPAEDGLERREPIGRFFHDVEEHFHTTCNPLLFCWERRLVGELATCGALG